MTAPGTGPGFLTANSYFGLALEASRGVAASVSTFTPIGAPKVEPKVTWLDDNSFEGSPNAFYDKVPGVRHDEFSGKAYLYTDVFPQLLRGTLGSTDTVASVAPSTWSHTIGLLNSPNTGSQPPSYTVINDSVDNTYQITAGQFSDLSISFGADTAVETTFSIIGNPATTVASVSANLSSQHLVPGWNVSASIGGVAVSVVETGQLDIKRSTAPIHVIGMQAPYANWASHIEATGKFVFVVAAGQTYWANSLVRDQQLIQFQFTDPATGYSTYFQMSTTQLMNPVIDTGKAWISLSADFAALPNTTDAVNLGTSPLLTKTTNGISVAY
jgi:hypothetical protein